MHSASTTLCDYAPSPPSEQYSESDLHLHTMPILRYHLDFREV